MCTVSLVAIDPFSSMCSEDRFYWKAFLDANNMAGPEIKLEKSKKSNSYGLYKGSSYFLKSTRIPWCLEI